MKPSLVRPVLAACAVLASLASAPSARADEVTEPSASSAVPVAAVPVTDAPVAEPRAAGARPSEPLRTEAPTTGAPPLGAAMYAPTMFAPHAGAYAAPPVAPYRAWVAPVPAPRDERGPRDRTLGIGLTVTGVLTGAGAAALFVAGANGGCEIFGDDDGLEYCLAGAATTATTAALLGVGIPLWAANSRELPRPPVNAELGVGPGSIELRGSF